MYGTCKKNIPVYHAKAFKEIVLAFVLPFDLNLILISN